MATSLDSWEPDKSKAPDYFETVKFVYKHLDFHIAEHEAYLILDTFIVKWNESLGKVVHEEEFKKFVVEQLKMHHFLMLPEEKIKKVIGLILNYLRAVGQYQPA
ncbi:MAG: hypothetical protein NZ522_01020 [Chitinophagales bacterium]|nr:hypothetical protein [Chitinophagales bacterium]